jgi:hypothetical protein
MAYVKEVWVDGSGGGTPIDATSLNHMEGGIETADVNATQALSDASDAQGDATTALANAATAQSTADGAVTTANAAVAETLIDAKGDLIVGSTADTAIRLPVGADGRILEADSGEASGLVWGRKITVDTVAPLTPATGDIWIDIS